MLLWMFLTLAPHWKLCNRNLLGTVVHGILELTCKVFWKCVAFGQPLPGAPLLQRFFSGEFSPAIPTCASWIWQVSNNHSFAYSFTILFFFLSLCVFFPFWEIVMKFTSTTASPLPNVSHNMLPLSSVFPLFNIFSTSRESIKVKSHLQLLFTQTKRQSFSYGTPKCGGLGVVTKVIGGNGCTLHVKDSQIVLIHYLKLETQTMMGTTFPKIKDEVPHTASEAASSAPDYFGQENLTGFASECYFGLDSSLADKQL